LKPGLPHLGNLRNSVAPFAGAWIETNAVSRYPPTKVVAPFAGAWIETPLKIKTGEIMSSRALRGRVD